MTVRELGDFQTPRELVAEILQSLSNRGRRWTRVLEPTCGCGNFIEGLLGLKCPPSEVVGIEVQRKHMQAARALESQAIGKGIRLVLVEHDLFNLDLENDITWDTDGPLLVVGNPPWVTNSELGSIGGSNVPQKTNFKRLRGIDALTGCSNFDIAEYIWIKLIQELKNEQPHIALLCKTSVARNVVQYSRDSGLPISNARMTRIDAKKWFGASAGACLLEICIGGGSPNYEVEVYESLSSETPVRRMGFRRGILVPDLVSYQQVTWIDGVSPLTWRQGVKHDAAGVMELTAEGQLWYNGLGEVVNVEEEYIFPLLKGSDLHNGGYPKLSRSVIIPQRDLKDDPGQLRLRAPKLWQYLTQHREIFARRKSSIYSGKPEFSIFGVGPYTFSRYKVAVSGLYKRPRFIAVGLTHGKPVVFDDTCYLVACGSPEEAATIASLLNLPQTQTFLDAAMFEDCKRPITKRLLGRIDIGALACRTSPEELLPSIHQSLCSMNKSDDGIEAGTVADLAGWVRRYIDDMRQRTFQPREPQVNLGLFDD